MDDAWQNNDMAPQDPQAGISIPTEGMTEPAPMNTDEPGWNGNGKRSSRSRSPGDRGRDGSDQPGGNPGNNLHVSGLSVKVDSRDLEDAFAKVGRVKKASVMYDPHSRESRGFGFVTMQSGEEADAAITALNGTEFMGKTLKIEKARRGRARTPTPGRYYGPPKRHDYDRPYDPRPYDSRYRDDRRARSMRYDDRRDDRGYRDRYDDRDRYYDRRDDRRDYRDRPPRDDRRGRYDDDRRR